LIRLEHVVPTPPDVGRALPLGALFLLELGWIEWIDSHERAMYPRRPATV
jgi:hypothetical protein